MEYVSPHDKAFRLNHGIIFVFVSILSIITGLYYYRSEAIRIRESRSNEIVAIGEFKAGQIQQWRQDRLADANRAAKGPFLTNAVATWLHNPIDQSVRTDLLERLRLEGEGSLYADVLLLDEEGQLILSLSNKTALTDTLTRHTAFKALSEREATLSDFFRSDTDNIYIDTVAPVLDEKNTPLAVLVLRIDANTYLYPLIESFPSTIPSVETVLAEKEGDEVLFLNKLRFKTDTALSLRLPLSITDNPAAQAVLGKVGILRGNDYRGIEVLSYLRPISGSPWVMVTKMDWKDIMAEARYRSIIIFLFVSFFIFLAAGVTAYLYRQRQAVIYQNLFQTERKHREINDRHRATLYSIGDAVITTDSEGKVLESNQVSELLTGWKEAEAKGKPLSEVFHIISEESDKIIEDSSFRVLCEDVMAGLDNHTMLVAGDGTVRPIAISGAPVRDENGVTVGSVLVFRDQTEERQAQKSLQESEARYRALFDTSADGILIADIVKWQFKYANPSICRMLGYSEEELLVLGVADIHPKEVLDSVFASIKTHTRGERIQSLDIPCLQKDGNVLYADINTTSMAIDGVACSVGFYHDISERKQAEALRVNLEAQLRQDLKMEAVGRLAGGVAHDFNNMLTIICGYADISLQFLTPSDSLYANIIEIRKAGQHSADLTRQLLAFARQQTISPKTLDLNELIQQSGKMLNRLIGEDIEYIVIPGSDLWNVCMDPSQVDQILANLAINSRDAIDGVGKIVVETANITIDRSYSDTHAGFLPGEYVLITFSDTGSGMDKQTAERIFEPFFTTKEEGKGTGLGLATVYGIVKQNNGYITVYSEPGQGTTFRIYIPRFHGIPCPEVEVIKENRIEGDKTILVVEDDIQILKLCRRVLESAGYTVISAASPKEAIALIENYNDEIQLLLTDLVMPEMNGKELKVHIENLQPGIKTLFMSGYAANIIAHHRILDKEINFIQKPFSPGALICKIGETINQ
jgi:PAS domain S-box-containing protein